MFQNTQGRHVGVMIPSGQLEERTNLADLTVVSVNPFEMMGIVYVENGRLKPALVVKDTEGMLYLAPNGDQWTRGLRQLSNKLARNVKDGLDRVRGVSPTDVPMEDNVDVIAEEMASEPATTP